MWPTRIRRSLPLTAAAKFLRRPQVLESSVADGKLPFVGREIPLDQEKRMWIGFLGLSKVTHPPTFPLISYVDVLNNSRPIWCGASWFSSG